jgi:hypothetical protein
MTGKLSIGIIAKTDTNNFKPCPLCTVGDKKRQPSLSGYQTKYVIR